MRLPSFINENGGFYDFIEHGDCSVCGQTGLTVRSVRVSYGISENGGIKDAADISGKGGSIDVSRSARGEMVITARSDEFHTFAGWSDGNKSPQREYGGSDPICALFTYKTYNMPVVSIRTEGSQMVTHRDYYLKCTVGVTHCAEKYALESAAGQIRVRGNASSNYGDPEYAKTNKVHYRLKFDEKTAFLGVNGGAKCKSWVLLRGDGSYLREPLSFKLFDDITKGKYYASDYTFVQLYINGDYYGAYILCEQTQINKSRIAISEKSDNDTGLRTGHLIEIDNYYGDEPYTFMLDYGNVRLTDMYGVTRNARAVGCSVKYDKMTRDQLDFVARFVRNAYAVVYNAIYNGEYCKLDDNNDLVPAPEFANARECVANVLDLDAAAAMYITREVAAERDGGIGSFFMYVDFKAKHPLLTFCAPWDFSWAYGTSDGFANDHFWVSAFQPPEFAYAGDRSFTWFITLYKADFFKEIVKAKWRDMTARGVQNALLGEIDRVKNSYAADFAMNKKRWNESDQAHSAEGIRRFLSNRIAWLDTQWK